MSDHRQEAQLCFEFLKETQFNSLLANLRMKTVFSKALCMSKCWKQGNIKKKT